MAYTRQYVEVKGKMGAGITYEDAEWCLVNILGDIPIYCRKDDASVSPCLITDGYWEAWITAWVLNEVDDQTLFIDVGANTGYYSLIAKRRGAKVVAFEPNPKYVKMLNASLDLEPSEPSEPYAVVHPWAVSNKVGQATLSIPKSFQGSASIASLFDQEVYPSDDITVLTTTIDRSFSGIKCEKMVIKIDAEGAEELIWDGMQDTLEKYGPTVILEYTPGAYGRDFLNKLEAYADLAWIGHSGEEEPISQNGILSNADWIMLVLRKRN